MAGREDAEVPAQAQVVVTRATHCKGTIREGRFAGRRCGNAVPCIEHDIMPIAYNLQAMGPDEYPLGFYIEMARGRWAEMSRPKPMRVRIRFGSVLR